MTDAAVSAFDATAAESSTPYESGLTANAATNADTQEIRVDQIRVDAAFNPRKKFDEADTAEFAERIRASGWLSPPLVRPDPLGEGFLLVAGERRLRAIRHLGWETVQVTVKSMSDVEHRQLALAENVDRRDLTIAEEALAARDHLAAYEGDHDAAAKALGWPVARLRHRLKLLHASPAVLDALMQREIQLGHAELLANLPIENQDKALPHIVSSKMSVADLREQINGFVTPLASAIFDTAGCANCVFNTSCQGTLFEARVEEGNCTNKACFREKSEAALELKRAELKSDFGTVVLISERADEQWVPLVKSGDQGVGTDQFEACRTCEHRGAAIHDAPGARLGDVESPLCFNTACHAQHVASHQQTLKDQAAAKEATTNAPVANQASAASQHSIAAPAPKAAPKKPKAQSVLKSVSNQYGEIVGRAGAEAMSRSPAPGLALAVYALTRIAEQETSTPLGDTQRDAGLPTFETGMSDSAKLAALAGCDPAVLGDAIQKIAAHVLTTDVNAASFQARLNRRAVLPVLASRNVVNMAEHVQVNEEFLQAHTKPAIEAVLDESGFKEWMSKQEDGDKRYRTLIGGKKDDLIKGVLEAGFSFDGYVPSGLEGQIKVWQKAERMPASATMPESGT